MDGLGRFRVRRTESSGLVGAVTLAVLLAACSTGGGAVSTSPVGGQGPSAGSSAPTAAGDPSAAGASQGTTTAKPAQSAAVATPVATSRSVNVDLATLLPTQIAGKPITIEMGTNPTSFLNLWKVRADAEAFLATLGKTKADLSLVYGSNSADFPNVIYMTGYRLAGADGQALGQGMAEALARRLGEWTVTTETVAGRKVIKLAAKDVAGGYVPHYYVVIGDTVVDVQGNPQAWADEAISKLP